MSQEIARGVDPYASQDAAARFAEAARHVPCQFIIGQTDLLAGTAFEIVAPCDGYLVDIYSIVQAAVTTGGAVTVEVNGVAVAGLSLTVADAAAKGDVDSGSVTYGTATARVRAGDRIEIIPSAAFALAGALNGFVHIRADGQAPAA